MRFLFFLVGLLLGLNSVFCEISGHIHENVDNQKPISRAKRYWNVYGGGCNCYGGGGFNNFGMNSGSFGNWVGPSSYSRTSVFSEKFTSGGYGSWSSFGSGSPFGGGFGGMGPFGMGMFGKK